MNEDVRQSETGFVLGEDLYGVSVTEIETRIARLHIEVERLEIELRKKKHDLSAADLLFSQKNK